LYLKTLNVRILGVGSLNILKTLKRLLIEELEDINIYTR